MTNSEPDSSGFAPDSVTILVALVLVLGGELLRVMLTLEAWWLRGEVGTFGVIPYAFGPFVFAFFAAVFAQGARIRVGIAAGVGVLAIARLVEQASRSSEIDLWAAVAGVAGFLWVLALLAAIDLRRFGLGLLFGVAFDQALKAAFRTLDLSWINGFVPMAIVVVLVGAMCVAGFVVLRGPLTSSGPAAGRSWALLTLGPVLFVVWQVVGSSGWISTMTGWPPELAVALVLLGLAGAVWAFSWPPRFVVTAAAVMVLVASAVFGRWMSPWFGLLAFGGLVSAGVVVAAVTRTETQPGLGSRTVLAVATGNLLMVILMFAYYTTLDLDLPFNQPAVLTAAAGLTVLALLAVPTEEPPPITPLASIVAVLLLVVPGVLWVTNVNSSPIEARAPFTVMTYNIAQGIANGGQLDLEAVAVIVDDTQATVIGFQEISRSYLVASGTDLVWWLSHRLDLPYTYGWAEDGGNATLTRFPVVSTELHLLPLLGTPQQRTALETVVDVDTSAIVILNTHLTQRVTAGIPDEDKEDDYATVQIPQIEAILTNWNDREKTVLVGDFNMRPDWKQTKYLMENGFFDGWEAGIGPGYTTEDNGIGYRIDYIFHTSDLEPIDAHVISSDTALDHLPVVVDFVIE